MCQAHDLIRSLLTPGGTETEANHTKHCRSEERHAENTVTVYHMETQWSHHINNEYKQENGEFI